MIISIEPAEDNTFRTGNVSFGGMSRSVNLALVPEAVVGDYVLVHVGVAISRIDEEEAKQTLAYMEAAGITGELNPEAS